MKSKKIIGAIAAVVMSASLSAALAACGGSDEHTHSWQYKDIGGGYHRQECSCGEYKESDKHHDVDGNDECDECHADLTTVVAVKSVTLDQTRATITVGGETLTLTATVNPVGAATVLWESSDVTVATVSTSGVVTPVKAGIATITAKAGDKSATCEITVNAAPPSQTVEMDEEKWEAALTFGDRIGATSTMISDKHKTVQSIKFDGKKVYMYGNTDGIIYESYVEETDGGDVYEYSKGYEYWTKEKSTEGLSIEYLKTVYLSLTTTFPFEKFEKGTVNGEYVAKEAYSVTVNMGNGDRTQNVKSAALHFDGNGKLVSGEYVIEGREGDEHYYAAFDYTPTVHLPVALLGGEVTPDQWNAALAMQDSNYRVGVKMYGMVLNEFKRDGNKRFTSYGTPGNDGSVSYDQTYYAKESDGIYAYRTEHGRTTKTKTTLTDAQYAQMTAIQFFGINTAQYVKSNFEFDEEDKSYNATLNDEYDGETQVSVKFKDGKLVWARRITRYEDYTIDFVYGDTNITLPSVTAVGGQVTPDEWTAALAMSDSKMQMEIDVTYGTYLVGEMVGEKDGDKLYQVQKTNEQVIEMYAVKEGDKYYGYVVSGGKWVKTEMPQTEYNNYLPSAIFTGLNKDGFTWNADTQSYVKTTSEGIGEIRFVNKKVDYVVQYNHGSIMKYYFSYGSGMVTVPTVGDAADSDDYPVSGGGGGGGDVEVKPSIDIDEKEWGAIFEDVYACPEFSVHVYSDSVYQAYAFNDKASSIEIDDIYAGNRTVYKVVDGTLKKTVLTDEGGEEQECEFATLEEAKSELIGRFFVIERIGNIVKLYSQFQGKDGQYNYFDGEKYVTVSLREDGRLYSIDYGNVDDKTGDVTNINFSYPTSEGSQESEKN